MYFLNSPLT